VNSSGQATLGDDQVEHPHNAQAREVRVHLHGQALVGKRVDHCHSESRAATPGWGRVYPQRSAHPHKLSSPLAAQDQTSFAIVSVHLLVVHRLAFTSYKHVQVPIAEARLLAS
jgi:hypothetical protein